MKPIIINVRWFRDFALEKRIGHIIYCVENNEWPVGKSYSAYTGCQGIDLDAPLYETVKRIPTTVDLIGSSNIGSTTSRSSNTPDVITITTDQNLSKQYSNQPPVSTTSQPIITNLQTMASPSTTQQQINQNYAAVAVAAATSAQVPNKKQRKRHIAIDVETERAKLHALLNNSQSPSK